MTGYLKYVTSNPDSYRVGVVSTLSFRLIFIKVCGWVVLEFHKVRQDSQDYGFGVLSGPYITVRLRYMFTLIGSTVR